MGETVNWTIYDTLPNVNLYMSGGRSLKPDNVDVEDVKKRSHFEQYFNWRIDEYTEEFVIRISRKPEAPPHGHTTVAVKIEGGLTQQPDGSVVFDGGVARNGVSKFGLSFEISDESNAEGAEPKEEELEEEPELKEIKFFDHSEHKLILAPENYCKDVVSGYSCDACTEPIEKENAKWVYLCPHRECEYCVHAACAQLPGTIRHPSHPRHTLKLLKLPPFGAKVCDVCKRYIPHGLHYHCAQCDFDLHLLCPEPAEDCDVNAAAAASQLDDNVAIMQALLNSQTQLMQNQMGLDMARRTARMTANAGRVMNDLAGPRRRYDY